MYGRHLRAGWLATGQGYGLAAYWELIGNLARSRPLQNGGCTDRFISNFAHHVSGYPSHIDGKQYRAREIASERDLYEKERLNGLRPSAYALSKILFTSLIAVGQGVWMMLFVKFICGFPGSFLPQGIA